jgi:hypothetical protein
VGYLHCGESAAGAWKGDGEQVVVGNDSCLLVVKAGIEVQRCEIIRKRGFMYVC